MTLGRRSFLKATLAAATVSLLAGKLSLVREAFAEVKRGNLHLVWLQGAGCSGCTVSLLNTTYPDVVDVVLGILPGAGAVSIDFHPTIMAEWGEEALKALERAERGLLNPYILVVEGSIQGEPPEGKGFWCLLGSETFEERFRRLASKAVAVVAVGSCASYGGIPAAKGSVTGARGCLEVLGREWASTAGLPVVNVPGCPPSGDWIVETLAHLILAYKGVLPPPELDEVNRPAFLYRFLAHEHCPRATFFAESVFSERFGEPYCMFKLGCKGPLARCDVPERGWINGVGGCPNSGGPCIGCTEPGFPDLFEPFTEAKLPQPLLPPRLEAAIPAARRLERPLETPPSGFPYFSGAAFAAAALAAAMAGLYLRKRRREG